MIIHYKLRNVSTSLCRLQLFQNIIKKEEKKNYEERRKLNKKKKEK